MPLAKHDDMVKACGDYDEGQNRGRHHVADIGTAMRSITSEPASVLHRIGTRRAMIATTVIILGLTRSTAPSMMAL